MHADRYSIWGNPHVFPGGFNLAISYQQRGISDFGYCMGV
jgi:hypothetical protein